MLLRTAATGLCHSDLHYLQGKRGHPTPLILGHEASAVVEKVGSSVTRVAPGDHVVVFCAPGWGRCRQCLERRPQLCTSPPFTRPAGSAPRLRIGDESVNAFSGLGTFAEQMIVYESFVVSIRKDMPLDKAALVSCAVVTGVGAAIFTAQVKLGQSVAVIGAGGVGLNTIQGARLAGAHQIIAVDRLAATLKLALQLGATHTVDASTEDPVQAVRDLTSGGVDHAFEAIGLPAAVEQAYAMLRPGGTTTVIGILASGVQVQLPGADFLLEKRLQGCHMGSGQFEVHLPMLIDLYLDGRLDLDPLVADRLTLDSINEGFHTLAAGRLARTVIVF